MHEYAQITGSILIRLYGCYEESRVMHTLIIHHHPPCRFSKRLSEQAWISPKHSDSYWKPRTFGKKNMQKTSIRLHPMIINHPLRMIFPTFRLWGLQLSCGSGLRQKGLPKPLRWPWPGDEPTWSNMEKEDRRAKQISKLGKAPQKTTGLTKADQSWQDPAGMVAHKLGNTLAKRRRDNVWRQHP